MGKGTKWKRACPQFHSMVSSVQCSGRTSMMRYTSPSGAKASSPARKRSQEAMPRVAAVSRKTFPLWWLSVPWAHQ